jgi:hypothetical protein
VRNVPYIKTLRAAKWRIGTIDGVIYVRKINFVVQDNYHNNHFRNVLPNSIEYGRSQWALSGI